MASMASIPIRHVFSGSNACHSVIVAEDGRCFTFGRNTKGQLGTWKWEKECRTKSEEKKRVLFIGFEVCFHFISSSYLSLGHGDCFARNVPTLLSLGDGGERVISAACGRHFTLFATASGVRACALLLYRTV